MIVEDERNILHGMKQSLSELNGSGQVHRIYAFESAEEALVQMHDVKPDIVVVNPADKKKYEEEEIIKFIYGRRNISEFEDFIQTLRNTYQLDRYIETAEKDLRALGMIQ